MTPLVIGSEKPGGHFFLMLKPKGLKVCFLAGSLGYGGAERQLFYMIQALLSLGVKCFVLSLTEGETYEDKIRRLGVPVVWVGQSKSKVKRLRRIVYETKQWRPDIIQSAHSFANLYAFGAAWLTRCVDIGAVRTDGVAEFKQLGFWGYWCVASPTVLVANSSQAIQAIGSARLAHKPIYLLTNVVDCGYFHPLGAEREHHSSDIQVLSVGSLKKVKRHDIFLQAVAQARGSVPTLKACLVGAGPLLGHLEMLAAELNLWDCVEFVGAVDEMPRVYQDATMLVHTSDCEGMPNVILEAMACGLPVISTRAGAAPDLIDEGTTGFVTEMQDVAAIASKIVLLAQNPCLYKQMGFAARSKAVRQYSLEALGSNLYSIYASLLSSSR